MFFHKKFTYWEIFFSLFSLLFACHFVIVKIFTTKH
jgi:hypothetical protein